MSSAQTWYKDGRLGAGLAGCLDFYIIMRYYFSQCRVCCNNNNNKRLLTLDLDTWIIPGQVHPGIPPPGSADSYKPAGTEVLVSAVAHNNPTATLFFTVPCVL